MVPPLFPKVNPVTLVQVTRGFPIVMDWQIPERARDRAAAIAYFAIEWSLDNETHFANVSAEAHSFEVHISIV